MKKRSIALLLALVIVLSFALTACKKDTATDPSNEPGTPVGDQDGEELTGVDPAGSLAGHAADVPVNRYDALATPRTGNNATRPFVVQQSTFDGKFSPFFGTSAYDIDATSQTQLGLLWFDEKGEPQAGIEYPSYAYAYTQNLVGSGDSQQTVFKFWLKEGLVFSDGVTPVTIDDLLFSIYTYLDPKYDGSSTLYSLNIKGLKAYRLQLPDDQYDQITGEISTLTEAAKSETYDAAAAYAPSDFYYYTVDGVTKLANDIVNYVSDKYINEDYVSAYFINDVAYVRESDAHKIAYGVVMWGFGEPSEDGTAIIGADGVSYPIDTITLTDYANIMLAAYEGDLLAMAPEAVEIEPFTYVSDAFASGYAAAARSGEAPTSAAGITTGIEVCNDGVVRTTLEIVIDGLDPTAIFKLSVEPIPWQYYTRGFTGTLNANHVSVNDAAFIANLKEKNSTPYGAGPYIFDSFADNVITFTANDYYLLGSPKIKTLRYKVIDSGSEKAALDTGDVDYASPSATQTLIGELANDTKLSYTLVDNDGYGYIGVNAQFFPDFEVRKALASVFDIEQTIENYYHELASVNYRPMTKVQWAYPDNPTQLYPYDGTGATAKALFEAAGFTTTGGKLYYPDDYGTKYPHLADKAGKQVSIKMTLPSEAANHPAGSVFLNAQNVLASLGIDSSIEVDDSVLDKLNTAYESGIQIWAAAWGSGGVDPDMFQIWYSDPAENTGSSPAAKGLFWLFNNGSADQKAILVQLNQLIKDGRSLLDQAQRKPIYAQALELAASLAAEIPTYQRKNIYVYNAETVDKATLTPDAQVTPFRSPLSFIWEVELKG